MGDYSDSPVNVNGKQLYLMNLPNEKTVYDSATASGYIYRGRSSSIRRIDDNETYVVQENDLKIVYRQKPIITYMDDVTVLLEWEEVDGDIPATIMRRMSKYTNSLRMRFAMDKNKKKYIVIINGNDTQAFPLEKSPLIVNLASSTVTPLDEIGFDDDVVSVVEYAHGMFTKLMEGGVQLKEGDLEKRNCWVCQMSIEGLAIPSELQKLHIMEHVREKCYFRELIYMFSLYARKKRTTAYESSYLMWGLLNYSATYNRYSEPKDYYAKRWQRYNGVLHFSKFLLEEMGLSTVGLYMYMNAQMKQHNV
jgi:hypothetical protein